MSTLHAFKPLHGAATETLLCLHASATTGRAFETLVAPLRERFAVLTPDRLGYDGAQCWPVGTPASVDAEAEHLAPLLAARPQGVHLFGHSYGGAVALQMALRWPSMVKSLTLYEPARFGLLFEDAASQDAGRQISAIARYVCMLVLSGRQAEAAAAFIDYWSGTGSWQALDERRRLNVIRHMPKVRAEFEAAFADRTPLAAIACLPMPVRLIAGTASPLPTRRIVELLAATIPEADRLLLPGIGHMGPVTHALDVLSALPEGLQPAARALAA